MTTEDQFAPEPDPVFETRAELEAWARHLDGGFTARNPTKRQRAQINRIRRVTLAHLHLREGEG
jgi:hypothetical protein